MEPTPTPTPTSRSWHSIKNGHVNFLRPVLSTLSQTHFFIFQGKVYLPYPSRGHAPIYTSWLVLEQGCCLVRAWPKTVSLIYPYLLESFGGVDKTARPSSGLLISSNPVPGFYVPLTVHISFVASSRLLFVHSLIDSCFELFIIVQTRQHDACSVPPPPSTRSRNPG